MQGREILIRHHPALDDLFKRLIFAVNIAYRQEDSVVQFCKQFYVIVVCLAEEKYGDAEPRVSREVWETRLWALGSYSPRPTSWDVDALRSIWKPCSDDEMGCLLAGYLLTNLIYVLDADKKPLVEVKRVRDEFWDLKIKIDELHQGKFM